MLVVGFVGISDFVGTTEIFFFNTIEDTEASIL